MTRPPRWIWRFAFATLWLAPTLAWPLLARYEDAGAAAVLDVPITELSIARMRDSVLLMRSTPATCHRANRSRELLDAEAHRATYRVIADEMQKLQRRMWQALTDVSGDRTLSERRMAFMLAMQQAQSLASGTGLVDDKEDQIRLATTLREAELNAIDARLVTFTAWPVSAFLAPNEPPRYWFASWPPLDWRRATPVLRFAPWFLLVLAPLGLWPIVSGVRRERRWRAELMTRFFERQQATVIAIRAETAAQVGPLQPAGAAGALRAAPHPSPLPEDGERVAPSIASVAGNKEKESPRTIVPPARQSRHPRPRWLLRALAAIIGAALYWQADEALWGQSPYELQVRPDRDWRVIAGHGCVAIGDFPALTTAEAEVRMFYESIDTEQLPTLSTTLSDRLWLAKRIELACAVARTRAVELVERPGNAPVVVIAGWVVALAAVPFVLPLVRGLHSMWVRRRRLVRELCPTCAYPLFGLPTPRCPECGERIATIP
jgi:hypothetical protein